MLASHPCYIDNNPFNIDLLIHSIAPPPPPVHEPYGHLDPCYMGNNPFNIDLLIHSVAPPPPVTSGFAQSLDIVENFHLFVIQKGV
jgi:hypothetical protein